MKIVFMGTPDFASEILRVLIRSGEEIAAVVTQPDKPVGRKTLAVLLGRGTARGWYHVAMLAWLLAIILIVCIAFTGGAIVLPFMLLAAYPLVKALWMNPLTANMRLQAMPQVLSLNIALGTFYCAAILMSAARVAFTI